MNREELLIDEPREMIEEVFRGADYWLMSSRGIDFRPQYPREQIEKARRENPNASVWYNSGLGTINIWL